MPIEWREKMSVDGGVIDEDHRHLIDIINRFEQMSEHFGDRDDALAVLYALKFYTDTHFRREEALQRVARYPYHDAHKQEHADLIEKLDAIIAEANAANTPETWDSVSTHTASLLNHWLVDHVIGSDLKMRDYVSAMREEAENMGLLKDAVQG